MPANPQTTLAQLELDALRALSGADHLQKRILAAVSMGSPSIEESAYLIKCRVKDHRKLVEKVLNRRKSRPTYKPHDVTDIVGLRMLSLYRNGLPSLVERFIDFIQTFQQEPLRLFVGSTLRDAVHEVRIYRTSDEEDSSLILCLDAFDRAGFTRVYDPPEDHVPRPMEVYIHKKPSEYSSIHFVVWCRCHFRDDRFRLPLEVQIRTALEDIWGEIDHELKYKSRFDNGNIIPDYRRRMYDRAKSELRYLKKALDNCSHQADSIYENVEFAFGLDYQAVRDRIGSIDLGVLNTLSLKEELQAIVNELVSRERMAFELLGAGLGPSQDIASIVREFGLLARGLDECFTRYMDDPHRETELHDRARYYLPMEAAVCLYWQGRLLKLALQSQSANTKGMPGNPDGYLDEALKRYLTLEREFPDDPIVSFRIANTLEARGGWSGRVVAKYKESMERLSSGRLPNGHVMCIKIPRQLGIAYWSAAEDLRVDAERLGDENLFKIERQRYYLRALDVTKVTHRLPIDQNSRDASALSRAVQDENSITENNILEYAICYVRAGGSWEELARVGLTESDLRDMLNNIISPGISAISWPSIADTVRTAAKHLLQDDSLKVRAAGRVIELLEQRDWSLEYESHIIDEMLRDAKQDLT